jgi:hypothetical protein
MPVISPCKAFAIQSSKKRTRKSEKKTKAKTSSPPKAADVVNALNQAQEFIENSTSKDATSPRKAKRVREEENDSQTSLTAEANELAEKWMLEDDYAIEIKRRKSNTITSIACYESMSSSAKKSLNGLTLNAKLAEIKAKLNNLAKTLVALTALSDKRFEEIFNDALEQTNKGKNPTKKRRIDSDPSESEDYNVSDSKSPLPSPIPPILHSPTLPFQTATNTADHHDPPTLKASPHPS